MARVFRWNDEKNESLLRERGVSFDMVLEAMDSGGLLDDVPHPDAMRYPHQRILQVMVQGYACAVPYVQQGDICFLKTIYRSRKVNRLHSGV